MKFIPFYIIIVVAFLGCSGSGESYPRPLGYHRIVLPKHEYKLFDEKSCPFTFEYPTYARIVPKKPDSCFYDLQFDRFACRLYLTTRDFRFEKTNAILAYEDFRELVYKHTQKAKIFDKAVRTANGMGTIFELYGEAPTPMQFYFTDSTKHAIVTSLYFNTAAKNDSLAPVISFLKDDMLHMMNTLRWR